MKGLADLKRVASSSGLYAVGEILNRGLAFLLLPIYTRFLDPADYGALELFNAFSGVLFAFLLLGMPSALNKCFHRDCETEEEKSSVLATSLLVDLPLLLLGGSLLLIFAEPVGRTIIGQEGMATLVRLVVATAVVASLMAIVLSSFRARERSLAFVAINLLQFAPAIALNIILVVRYDMGVRGVLWGNLISACIALPVGLWLAAKKDRLRFEPRLVKPLVHFGALLVPITLATWVIDLSDRYVLRIYSDLEQIAIYAVGYKIGMILNMALVWPFQLAWPAVAFSISKRPDHHETYARTTTYFGLAMTVGWLGLALVSRPGLPFLAGDLYRHASAVVPWVALAYLFNGLHFCVSPGIHVEGKTRSITLYAGLAALINLGLNFLLVPRFGILGAAGSTTFTFFFLAVATWWRSQQVHPVPHETVRHLKILLAAVASWCLAVHFEPTGLLPGLLWHGTWATVGFLSLLFFLGFLDVGERQMILQLSRRLRRRDRH